MIFPATDETISRAASLLAAGQLVGLPTETVYGLAANAWDASAVMKIFAAKNRPSNNPLIVHVAGVERLADAIQWPPSPLVRQQLDAIADLWPGPLTVVCPRSSRVPNEVTAGRDTVAVRVPAHDVALSLLEACDFPLAAPSANRSKYISPTKAEHLFGATGIAQHLSMVLDGGACQWGVESTIVKLGDRVPQLLRPGAVPLTDLARRFQVAPEEMLQTRGESSTKALPTHQVTNGEAGDHQSAQSFMSPGMMREHYCPSTPLRLLAITEPVSLTADAIDPGIGLLSQGQRAARIAFRTLPQSVASRYRAVEVLSINGDLREVAHHLFDAMRRLDEEGFDVIHCDTCPPTGLGHAIMDRLRRASARTEG